MTADGDPLAAAVDRIVAALGARRDVAGQTAALHRLGRRAVPRLVHHLERSPRAERTLALYGLQECWAPGAEPAVRRVLADPDAELRRMAEIVLVRGAGYPALLAGCRPLLDHPDPGVAAFALDRVEAEAPDLARTRAALADPAAWPVLAPHLARYRAPGFAATLRAMRDGDDRSLWRPALVGLIHGSAWDERDRARSVTLLDDPDPDLRALAAEHLRWHGTPADAAALAAGRHTDPVPEVAAALAAATAAIARRAAQQPPRPAVADLAPPARADTPVTPPSLATSDAGTGADARATAAAVTVWRRAAGRLGAGARPAAWNAAWALYVHGFAMEPHWAYRGRDPAPGAGDAAEARLALQARLIAQPPPPPAPPAALAPTRGFAVPIRGYFDDAPSNYGLEVPDTAVEGFTGLVHVGHDVAWDRPLTGVHAIADGVVRAVERAATWGTLVVIEHIERNGARFCSLYAHLSPALAVAVGVAVAAGDLVGTVGRAWTWENGGYAAHLHFGVRRGRFDDPPAPGQVIDLRYRGRLRRARVVQADRHRTVARTGGELVAKPSAWATGYISSAWAEAGDHGWVDPRPFLAARAGAALRPLSGALPP